MCCSKLETESASVNKRLSMVEEQAGEVAALREQLEAFRKASEAKEGEMFEVNFELQSAQRNLKLVTADNDELEARLEETYQAGIEQKKMLDKYEAENEALRSVPLTRPVPLLLRPREVLTRAANGAGPTRRRSRRW